MTEENQVAPEEGVPQPAEPVAAPEIPASTPVVPAEAVKEISEAITEGLKDALFEVKKEEEAMPPEPQEAVPAGPSALPSKQTAGAHMREVVRRRKSKNLEMILELVARKKIITNNDIERELSVSDSSATRYLNELIKQGKLKRHGIRASAKYMAA